jgi:3-oxoacyl-[acyl-carrier-protein] synthase-1
MLRPHGRDENQAVQPLAIVGTGIVSSVGLSTAAACAAIRAKITNPTQTRFKDSAGDWIMSHTVDLQQSWQGRAKLAHMAGMAIEECMAASPDQDWKRVPLLLCVAEQDRDERLAEFDQSLLAEVRGLFGEDAFATDSAIVPHGRVSLAVALLQARRLVYEANAPAVLIAATDSLLSWDVLKQLEQRGRLLMETNSNGFIPGEAASAVLVAAPEQRPQLWIEGLGFALERATIESEDPIRADGLAQAINAALREAERGMHDMDFRITDLSGEHYYFKEAALAVARTLRVKKEEYDLWHPAECIGETGAAIGPLMLAVAEMSMRKSYAPGPKALVHMANDAGQRAAIITHYRVS